MEVNPSLNVYPEVFTERFKVASSFGSNPSDGVLSDESEILLRNTIGLHLNECFKVFTENTTLKERECKCSIRKTHRAYVGSIDFLWNKNVLTYLKSTLHAQLPAPPLTPLQ